MYFSGKTNKQKTLCEKVDIDRETHLCWSTVGAEANQCDRYRETIYLLLNNMCSLDLVI